MDRYCVASMSTETGWETQSPQAALAKHVTYWFQSRENQGKVMGKVPSFYMIFKTFSRDPEKMVEETRTKFKAYIEELFDNVLVHVERQNITGEINNYKLILTARVNVGGVNYDLAETILATGELYRVLDTERLKR